MLHISVQPITYHKHKHTIAKQKTLLSIPTPDSVRFDLIPFHFVRFETIINSMHTLLNVDGKLRFCTFSNWIYKELHCVCIFWNVNLKIKHNKFTLICVIRAELSIFLLPQCILLHFDIIAFIPKRVLIARPSFPLQSLHCFSLCLCESVYSPFSFEHTHAFA